MNPDVRAAILWVGILFCLAVLAMTAVVIVDLQIEQWRFATLLLVGFVIGGVGIILMILIALISALRNPPDE
jgi:hypothetical protein